MKTYNQNRGEAALRRYHDAIDALRSETPAAQASEITTVTDEEVE